MSDSCDCWCCDCQPQVPQQLESVGSHTLSLWSSTCPASHSNFLGSSSTPLAQGLSACLCQPQDSASKSPNPEEDSGASQWDRTRPLEEAEQALQGVGPLAVAWEPELQRSLCCLNLTFFLLFEQGPLAPVAWALLITGACPGCRSCLIPHLKKLRGSPQLSPTSASAIRSSDTHSLGACAAHGLRPLFTQSFLLC